MNNEPELMYTLAKDGQQLYTGTENECYIKLQKIQSRSADWAIKHEGYTIEPSAPVDEPNAPEVIDLRKTKPVMGSYYADQLKKVKLVYGGVGTPAQIKVSSASGATHWLTLNDESANDLVKWLHEHYNIAQPKADAYIVAYTSRRDEMDYYHAYIDDDRLEVATAHYNELLQDDDTSIASLCTVIKSTDYTFQSQQIEQDEISLDDQSLFTSIWEEYSIEERSFTEQGADKIAHLSRSQFAQATEFYKNSTDVSNWKNLQPVSAFDFDVFQQEFADVFKANND